VIEFIRCKETCKERHLIKNSGELVLQYPVQHEYKMVNRCQESLIKCKGLLSSEAKSSREFISSHGSDNAKQNYN
jgi:hypothetical protein